MANADTAVTPKSSLDSRSRAGAGITRQSPSDPWPGVLDLVSRTVGYAGGMQMHEVAV